MIGMERLAKSTLWSSSVLVLVQIITLRAADLPSSPKVIDTAGAKVFLEKFHYMGIDNPDPGMASITDAHTYERAIMLYQRNMGINVTGVLDADTMDIMNKPRCGMPDIMSMGDMSKRKKRFVLHGSRWSRSITRPLTYYIMNTTPDLPRTLVENTVARAFQAWGDVTNLAFKRRSSLPADIEVQFASYSHGDGNPFDGPSGTLAHAYFPSSGGNAHFDESERWTDGQRSGINFYQVAVHEIGHSLGLGHSDQREAIMYPSYLGYMPTFSLGTDDIRGIQRIYGQRATATQAPTPAPRATTSTALPTGRPPTDAPPTARPTTAPPTQSPLSPDARTFCQWGSFDAITTFNGATYAFRNNLVAKLGDSGFAPGYPKKISDVFSGLETNIDAALTWEDEGKTFFFKGDHYWRFMARTDGTPYFDSSRYPRKINTGFYGIPNDLDAAFVWGGNGRVYFMKGDKYYRYTRRIGKDRNYPQPLAVWRLPGVTKVDAAFLYSNKKTYFFVGKQYYRFDDVNFRVDASSVPYPRPVSTWWLDCSGDINDTRQGEKAEVENEFMDIDQDPDTTSGQTSLNDSPIAVFVCVFLFWVVTFLVDK